MHHPFPAREGLLGGMEGGGGSPCRAYRFKKTSIDRGEEKKMVEEKGVEDTGVLASRVRRVQARTRVCMRFRPRKLVAANKRRISRRGGSALSIFNCLCISPRGRRRRGQLLSITRGIRSYVCAHVYVRTCVCERAHARARGTHFKNSL